MQGEFQHDHRHGTGTLLTADGMTYVDMPFRNGVMQESAGRLHLQYPKTTDKKGVEQPVTFEPGVRVPEDFSVDVSIEFQDSNQSECVEQGESLPGEPDSWQVFAKESGRRITVRLHFGHTEVGQPLQEQVPGDVLGTWIASTTTDSDQQIAGDCESPTAETLVMAAEVQLTTDAGTCSLRGFQIGDGDCEVVAGPYTLAFSSDQLVTEYLQIAVGSKGKGK